MDDPLSIIREHDERVRKEYEASRARSVAKKARDDEYREAWNAVHHEMATGDGFKDHLPQFEIFVHLAKVLKSHGQFDWLPEMAENFKRNLDDIGSYRPAQFFVAQLLIKAGKPRPSKKQFERDYRAFVPHRPPQQTWRAQAVSDIREFISHRVVNAANEEANRRAEQLERDAKDRAQKLRTAATRRPAIEKHLFAVHWTDQGKRPAWIRDKWNESRSKDRIEGGEAGRDDIKKAVMRGREFLAENKTTAAEMAGILSFDLT